MHCNNLYSMLSSIPLLHEKNEQGETIILWMPTSSSTKSTIRTCTLTFCKWSAHFILMFIKNNKMKIGERWLPRPWCWMPACRLADATSRVDSNSDCKLFLLAPKYLENTCVKSLFDKYSTSKNPVSRISTAFQAGFKQKYRGVCFWFIESPRRGFNLEPISSRQNHWYGFSPPPWYTLYYCLHT